MSKEHLMDTLIFSQTAIFRLHQLGSYYYQCTGQRYRLANENGILNLLQSSALFADHKVRRAYNAFVTELNNRQITALTDRGVNLRLPVHASTASEVRKAG
jgi:hypothetical protein